MPQPPATATGDTTRQRTVTQLATAVTFGAFGARDTLTDTVGRLIAEAAEQKDAGEGHRAVIERELRSRLAAAEAAAAQYREKARDAASKLYHTKYNFLKRKMEVEDDDEEEEEAAETGDESSGASDIDEPQRARRNRPTGLRLSGGRIGTKWQEFYKLGGTGEELEAAAAAAKGGGSDDYGGGSGGGHCENEM
eukprot:jgi/Tetstr1/422364/TSEL_013204.t1